MSEWVSYSGSSVDLDDVDDIVKSGKSPFLIQFTDVSGKVRTWSFKEEKIRDKVFKRIMGKMGNHEI